MENGVQGFDMKEYALAMFTFGYLSTISFIISILSASSRNDMSIIYDIITGAIANSYTNNAAFIYAPLAFNKVSLMFSACFLPSLVFAIFIRFISSQRACAFAVVALPFMIYWQVAAQQIAMLLFIAAFWLFTQKKYIVASIAFIAANLSHRIAPALGAVLLVMCCLPERIYNAVHLRKATAALLGLLAIIATVSFMGYVPQLIGRGVFLASVIPLSIAVGGAELKYVAIICVIALISLVWWAVIVMYMSEQGANSIESFKLPIWQIEVTASTQSASRIASFLLPFSIFAIAASGANIPNKFIVLSACIACAVVCVTYL